MGFVVKLKRNQRIYLGDFILETYMQKGHIHVYIDGPNPFSLPVRRESTDEYYERLRRRKKENEVSK